MANVELSVIEGTVTDLDLSIPGVQGPPGEGIPSGGTANQVLVKTSSADYVTEWSEVTSAMLGDLEIVNADIAANAAIADTKLATISTAGKVSNNATTANSANTALTIVARDNNGNFSASTITANLTGNASTVTTNANLTGDIISVGNATSIATGAIVNADINASAAVALSKLATGALPSGITVASSNLVDGTIVNVDIASNAAIALTKLANGTLPSGIAIASGTQASTNLAYDTSTRALASSTGSGITVPLFTTAIAGLQPASSFSTIAYASGVALDMAALDQQYRTITMSGNLSLTTSNLANGRTVSLRLIASGATRALTVPSGWLFLGAKPTTVASGKTAVLSLTMFGSVDADCIAAYGVQA